jgi:hypothetical protein
MNQWGMILQSGFWMWNYVLFLSLMNVRKPEILRYVSGFIVFTFSARNPIFCVKSCFGWGRWSTYRWIQAQYLLRATTIRSDRGNMCAIPRIYIYREWYRYNIGYRYNIWYIYIIYIIVDIWYYTCIFVQKIFSLGDNGRLPKSLRSML